MVFKALRGSSVTQYYLDCCVARFVNLPRSTLVFKFLIKKQYCINVKKWGKSPT